MDKQVRKTLVDKCEDIDDDIKGRLDGNPEPTDLEKKTLIIIRNKVQELVSTILVA